MLILMDTVLYFRESKKQTLNRHAYWKVLFLFIISLPWSWNKLCEKWQQG